jgi:hypothetical protein
MLMQGGLKAFNHGGFNVRKVVCGFNDCKSLQDDILPVQLW